MAMLGHILHVPWNLEIFHDRLGQGLRDDVTALPFKDFSYRHETWWDGAQWHEANYNKKWPCSANFDTFHGTFQNKLGPGLRDYVTTLTLEEFQLSAWNLVGQCTVWWSRSLLKMVSLDQYLRIPWNFEIFHHRLGPGIWNWVNHITAWHLVAWSGSLYEIATLGWCLYFLILAGRGCCHSLNVLFTPAFCILPSIIQIYSLFLIWIVVYLSKVKRMITAQPLFRNQCHQVFHLV